MPSPQGGRRVGLAPAAPSMASAMRRGMRLPRPSPGQESDDSSYGNEKDRGEEHREGRTGYSRGMLRKARRAGSSEPPTPNQGCGSAHPQRTDNEPAICIRAVCACGRSACFDAARCALLCHVTRRRRRQHAGRGEESSARGAYTVVRASPFCLLSSCPRHFVLPGASSGAGVGVCAGLRLRPRRFGDSMCRPAALSHSHRRRANAA